MSRCRSLTLEVEAVEAGAGNSTSLLPLCADFPTANQSALVSGTAQTSATRPCNARTASNLEPSNPRPPSQSPTINRTGDIEPTQFPMASLRAPQASRLLRAVCSRGPQITARRYESSSIIKANQPVHEPAPPAPSQGAVGHNQPDYGAHIDKATSYASSPAHNSPRAIFLHPTLSLLSFPHIHICGPS